MQDQSQPPSSPDEATLEITLRGEAAELVKVLTKGLSRVALIAMQEALAAEIAARKEAE